MDSKEGPKKKGLSQDLLLDEFFKPPVEEEPEEKKIEEKKPAKETPISKQKQSIKKELLLDDFFKPPPSVEEKVKEVPPKEKPEAVTKEKEKPSIKEETTYREIRKQPAPPVVEPVAEKKPAQPVAEPTPISPPPQRSLKELLEEPLFETKAEPASPAPKPSSAPTPVPGVARTPTPVVVTGAPAKAERRGFPLLPVVGGLLGVILIGGAVAFFLTHSKGGEGVQPRVSKPDTVVEVKPTPPPLEQPVQKPQEPEQPQAVSVTSPPEEPKAEPEAQVPAPPTATPEPAPEKPIPPAPEKPAEKKVASVVNRFIVTAGPFKTKEEAKAQEIKLKVLGYTPKMTSKNETVEVYNLFVDPPVPEGEANVIRLKLSLKGFSAELVDAGANKRVKVGSFSSLSEALEKKNQASELGYTITIDISKSTERVYNLEVGFPEIAPAREAVEKIKNFGIEATMVEKKG